MKALFAFFCAILFAVPVFAEEAQCVEVDQGSDRVVELTDQDYVVRDARTEIRPIEMVGVGVSMYIGLNSSAPFIEGVVPNSPAAQAGVPIGGAIIAVDGVPTGDRYTGAVAEDIRGKDEEGSIVRLYIMLKDGSTKTYTLTRTKFKVKREVTILRMCKSQIMYRSL